jgi:hypothetical protein
MWPNCLCHVSQLFGIEVWNVSSISAGCLGMVKCSLYRLLPTLMPFATALPLLVMSVTRPFCPMYLCPSSSHLPNIRLFLVHGTCSTSLSNRVYLWPSQIDWISTVPHPFACAAKFLTPIIGRESNGVYVLNSSFT